MGDHESPATVAPRGERLGQTPSPANADGLGQVPSRIGSSVGNARRRARRSLEAAAYCAGMLSSAGPLAALAYLNSRTRFRFTGIYHAEPPYLLNLHLYDRENPAVNVSGEACLLTDTYCAIVCANDRPFRTADARRDPRLSTHAACATTLSYCGVPVRLDDGVVWGSLCHFDVRPRLLPPSELEVLELVAPYFAARLEGADALR